MIVTLTRDSPVLIPPINSLAHSHAVCILRRISDLRQQRLISGVLQRLARNLPCRLLTLTCLCTFARMTQCQVGIEQSCLDAYFETAARSAESACKVTSCSCTDNSSIDVHLA